ncbi:hypothetical protein AMAG_06432 [Allomyces macrogynus ATCC 38327]|uniref:Inositol polyphosphate-related phosphatase domain-containing protein n=1 Tax=Allomyces macrogynus (strain ATCC 38327) TaxID=578462 RepID=A0A0L0SGY1_ALLM3|nr:hypothetical protein AMAG_06432 [Allomyces macrogynus ATCC 38327]|eukprot:KNE61620.1 hypothetical protein AMAG_06432 [Allomyces macrogynus ATCC 38327]
MANAPAPLPAAASDAAESPATDALAHAPDTPPPLHVLAVTANLNRAGADKHPDWSLIGRLAVASEEVDQNAPPPDLVSVSLQEAASDALLGVVDDAAARAWQAKILTELTAHLHAEYLPVARVVWGPTVLIVVARAAASSNSKISNVCTTTCALGPALLPNKAAVAVSLTWEDRVRVALVGTHLRHGQNPQPRWSNWVQLCRGLVFDPTLPEPAASCRVFTHDHLHGALPVVADTAIEHPATSNGDETDRPDTPRLRRQRRATPELDSDDQAEPPSSPTSPLLGHDVVAMPPSSPPPPEEVVLHDLFADHDVVIVLGDLNSRTSARSAQAHAAASACDIAQLVAWDQFTQKLHSDAPSNSASTDDSDEAIASAILAQFTEPPITFLPTYKLRAPKPATGARVVPMPLLATTPHYDPKRIPSYTDRVLSWTRTGFAVKPHLYTAAFDLLAHNLPSDHVPVVAVLSVVPESAAGGGDAAIRPRRLHGLAVARDPWWRTKHQLIAGIWVWVLQSRTRAVAVVALLVAVFLVVAWSTLAWAWRTILG